MLGFLDKLLMGSSAGGRGMLPNHGVASGSSLARFLAQSMRMVVVTGEWSEVILKVVEIRERRPRGRGWEVKRVVATMSGGRWCELDGAGVQSFW